jgi:hypothetical protein
MGNNTQLTGELLQALSKDEIIELFITQVTALQLKVAELEERLNQNSTNSSRPPSSDGLSRPKPSPASLRGKSGKERGGQKGHKGHGLKLPYKITETKKIEPETCPCCGGDLHDTPGEKIETRYVHEIPKVEVTTTAYENYSKQCPQCGATVSGEFTEYVSGTQQYGIMV